MFRSLTLSILFHLSIFIVTFVTLPFVMKKPIDVPPIISVDLIQISEKTALPFAPKAREIIEKIKEEKQRVVTKQAPPKIIKKEKQDDRRPGGLYLSAPGSEWCLVRDL